MNTASTGRDTDSGIHARLDALEGRVARLEDESDIRALLAHHDYCFDCKRDEEWLALWTTDGTYDLLSTVVYPDGEVLTLSETWTGIDRLRTFITNPEGHHRPGFYGHSLHTAAHDLVIHVNGDRATATSYSLLFQESGGNLSVLSGANNRWTFVRCTDGWLLESRRRRQVGTDPFPENLLEPRP